MATIRGLVQRTNNEVTVIQISRLINYASIRLLCVLVLRLYRESRFAGNIGCNTQHQQTFAVTAVYTMNSNLLPVGQHQRHERANVTAVSF